VGKVDFEGLTVFKPEGVRTLFKLEPGNVYREGRIKKGYEKLRELYGSQGYFQWHGFTKRKPDPDKKVVDVTLAMEEDKRYFVGRITFTGNDVTRDKVIRREVYLNEGDVFNASRGKSSRKRSLSAATSATASAFIVAPRARARRGQAGSQPLQEG
jgi:outer membrane protein insertion porin family